MTRLTRQVAAAEAALARRDAATPRAWHRIVQQVGQSEDDAIDAMAGIASAPTTASSCASWFARGA